MLLFKREEFKQNVKQVLIPKYMLNDIVFHMFKGHVILPLQKKKKINEYWKEF